MEFLQERGDMVMTFLTEGQSGSVVSYFLYPGYLPRGNASQKMTAVVNSRKGCVSQQVQQLPLR